MYVLKQGKIISLSALEKDVFVQRYVPTFLRKWYARRHGYFWLPCTGCEEQFGGFESGNSVTVEHEELMPRQKLPVNKESLSAKEIASSITIGPIVKGTMICPKCSLAAISNGSEKREKVVT